MRHRGRDSSAEYELILHDRKRISGHQSKTGNPTSQDRQIYVARPEAQFRENQSQDTISITKHAGARQARQRVAPRSVDSSSTPIEESAARKAPAREAPYVQVVDGGAESKKIGARVEILSPGALQDDGGGLTPPLCLDNGTHEIVSPHRARRNTTASKSNRKRANAIAREGAR